jgi:hypothetical protein
MLQPLFARLVTPLLGGSSMVEHVDGVLQAALLEQLLIAHTLQSAVGARAATISGNVSLQRRQAAARTDDTARRT